MWHLSQFSDVSIWSPFVFFLKNIKEEHLQKGAKH